MAPFIRRYRGLTITVVALSVVAQVMIGLLPLIQQQILDHSIENRDRRLAPMIILLVATGSFGFATNYGRRYLASKGAVDLQHDIRVAIHRHLYELDFARHDQLSVGDIMSRATGDLTLIQMFFASVPIMINNVTLLIVAITVMFFLSPLLSLVIAVFVPLFIIVGIRYRDRVFPSSWNDQRGAGAVAGVVDESVTGVRVVKAFAQEDREFERVVGRSKELFQSRMRTARFNARYASVLQLLPSLGQLGVLGFGGWLALRGNLTLGVFLAYSSYLVQLISPVRIMSSMLATTQQARAGSERIFELFDMQPIVTKSNDPRPVERPVTSIEFDRVSFGYDETSTALTDVSLRIEPGETIALVGSSGSGKSTLAYLMARFFDPTDGTVRINDMDARDAELRSLRTAVNVVFEDSFLFSTTIADNIAYGRPDATRGEIVAAAKVAQADDFITELANGYDTPVGERGFTLSGGQRQRIALARAALTNPGVLVLDDATSAIDAATEERIHHSFASVVGTRTTVLIAHRASTLRLATRVAVLDAGRIVAVGTNADLYETSALYRELVIGPEAAVDDPANMASIDHVDPTAWPSDSERDTDVVVSADLTSMFVGMASGVAMSTSSTAGLVAATPELIARVRALPPLRGDPKVDIADAIENNGRPTIRRLGERFRPALIAVAAFVVIDAATTLVGPLIVRHALDHGVEVDNGRVLVAMCVVFGVVQLISWVNSIFEQLLASRAAERMLFTLRLRTFAHLQRLSLDYYDREMGGRIMTRMTTDVEALAQLLQQGLLVALNSILACGGVIVILLLLDVRLAALALTVVPILVVVTVLFKRASRRAYLRAREAVSAVNAQLHESVAGVRVTQSLGRDDNNEVRFAATAWTYRTARLRSMQLMGFYFAASQFLSTVAKALALAYGAYLITNDQITIGLLIAFLLYLDQFFTPLQQLSAVFDQWIQARVSLNRLDELLQTPTSTPEAAEPIDPGRVHGDVRFEGVRFAYSPNAPEALRGIDLHIEAGQRVALVGTTGAGKSTFVKLAARFYDPTAGRILVDGNLLTQLDLPAYRRNLGYVPQEPFLFSGTIRSNIAYGKPDATDLDVERAARSVGAHGFIASLRLGYFTPVSESGRSMSAGQRQLLCLARAVIIDPAVLILDEATSNLDLATEAEVQQAMNRAADGRTTLLIAHRLQTARNANRIIVAEYGEIVEDGTHEELIADGGRYAALWEMFRRAARPPGEHRGAAAAD